MSWKSFRIPHRTALLSQELTVVITPQCIYGRPGGPLFTKNAFAAVLHHQQNPEFYDEVRRTAPSILRLGDECHSCVWVSTTTDCLFVLLFLSIRLSCQLSSTRSIICSSPSTMSAVITTAKPAPKRETWLRLKVTHNLAIASFKMSIFDFYMHLKHQALSWLSPLSVGYAWLPLLKDGRVILNENHIPVAANLPAGYLSCQESASKVEFLLRLLNSDGSSPLQLFHSRLSAKLICVQTIAICKYVSEKYIIYLFVLQHSGPEVKWVDGGKPLFRVSTHLVSTVYTQVSFCAWINCECSNTADSSASLSLPFCPHIWICAVLFLDAALRNKRLYPDLLCVSHRINICTISFITVRAVRLRPRCQEESWSNTWR